MTTFPDLSRLCLNCLCLIIPRYLKRCYNESTLKCINGGHSLCRLRFVPFYLFAALSIPSEGTRTKLSHTLTLCHNLCKWSCIETSILIGLFLNIFYCSHLSTLSLIDHFLVVWDPKLNSSRPFCPHRRPKSYGQDHIEHLEKACSFDR